VVKSAADLDSAAAALGGYSQGLYAEKWAPFVKELAVMVVRCGVWGVATAVMVVKCGDGSRKKGLGGGRSQTVQGTGGP
jgi:hypothetical protein